MQINAKKTKVMVLSKTPESVKANTFLDGALFKTIRSFLYLRSKLSADRRSHEEICNRLSQAESAFFKMKSPLCKPKIHLGVRFRLWRCYILPILLWTILEADRQKMTALEIWFLRRILRIKWNDKVSNKEVLVRPGEQQCLLNIIVKRQVQFLLNLSLDMMRNVMIRDEKTKDWISSDDWEDYRQEVSLSTKIEVHGSDESRDELCHNPWSF